MNLTKNLHLRLVSRALLAMAVACLPVQVAQAQGVGPGRQPSATSQALERGAAPPLDGQLQQISRAIANLVGRVARSVVQIVVTGYRPTADGRPDVIARTQTIGSGVVVDSGGYVMTNAHVVAGATTVDILFEHVPTEGSVSSGTSEPRVASATIVGVAPELDLALLRASIEDVPPLRLADSSALRQGELVFALGSPAGMRNSVSMGVVSAVARLADSDSMMPYVQTDAAINPGHSGGALVDAGGDLVGINTFIRSASGGSEGLAFAVPSAVVALALPQLRECGRLQRALTGMSVQAITPAIGMGLGLPVSTGLIVANVMPRGPAEQAGARIGDVFVSVDGRPVGGPPFADFYLRTLGLRDGEKLRVEVLRDGSRRTLEIVAVESGPPCTPDGAQAGLSGGPIDSLGVWGVPLAQDEAVAGGRVVGGVLVTARLDTGSAVRGMSSGDIVHAVNGIEVVTLDDLQRVMAGVGRGDAVVLQVERDGRLMYLTIDPD